MSEPSYWDVRRAAKENWPLLQKLGADFVTVGRKEVAGRLTGTKAVKVAVRRKADKPQSQQIPAELETTDSAGNVIRVKTDVVEVSEVPDGLGLRGGNILLAPDDDGGVVFIPTTHNVTNNRYALTNAPLIAL